VTLCFLGSRPGGEVAEIAACCRAAVSATGALELTVGKALWLPPRRPRVLTVELTGDDQGHLAAVQSALARGLVAGGFYEPEARPFLAHVTVARVARDASGRDASGRGARIRPRPLPAPAAMAFTGERVTLFASRLGAGPARYEALATATLSSS
jgi:2'-5' RNA ligase